MNARPLTDAQIARALRARLPEHAQAGLMDRIVTELADAPQQRTLPTFLAGLFDADPSARRRYQLIAATLLVALTLAVAAGVGAYLEMQRRLPAPLSLAPPADVDAYVGDSYEGIADLPALRITVLEEEGTKDRFIYDGVGILRHDHFDSPDLAEPSSFRLFRDGVMAEEADLDGERIWLEYTGQLPALLNIAMATGAQTTCDADPWAYVGLEYLIGRPAHHVTCGGDALWLDVETGLPLKSINDQEPADFPTITFTVLELVVGPQPADLFVPPQGLTVMNDLAYNCALDPTCEVPPTLAPTQTPFPRPSAAPGEYAAPADVDAFVRDVLAGYATLPALDLVVTYPSGAPGAYQRYVHDGSGRFRMERYYDPNEPPGLELFDGQHSFEGGYGTTADGRTIWKDWGPSDRAGGLAFGLNLECREGWEYEGVDLILERPAHHLVCRHVEVWVDVEWLLVTRSQTNPEPLQNQGFLYEVLELHFQASAPDLFELPEDALVCFNDRPSEDNCLDANGNPQAAPSPSTEPSPAP